jgi:hypothetical protein
VRCQCHTLSHKKHAQPHFPHPTSTRQARPALGVWWLAAVVCDRGVHGVGHSDWKRISW